ncbi:MAG TPA: cytochrome c oxidase assembly protein, partial [Thermomicrobiales bacterium]|nr:cytochrome c oxidase assembly protein [Thermomicrobiales bacterium]
VLIAAYFIFTGSRNRTPDGKQINPVSNGQRFAFVAGALTILFALNPPLDDWSGHFLLLAHMSQHMLLIMVAMPLLLIGTPSWLISRLIAVGPIARIGYYLTRPVAAFLISNLIIVLWHMPFGYDAALRHEPIHIAEHMTFLVAAFFLWWPILGRNPEWPSLEPLPACLYLFLQAIPGSMVGAFLTFAGAGVYAVYPQAPRIWGISLATDQQLAGLQMWVLNGMIFLGWITIIFLRWAADEERRDQQPAAKAPVTVGP